jgi:hypothetical protein
MRIAQPAYEIVYLFLGEGQPRKVELAMGRWHMNYRTQYLRYLLRGELYLGVHIFLHLGN